MKRQYLLFILVTSITSWAIAAPAAWYKWRSKLTGGEVCAQVMHGNWEKSAGPFKDAQCKKPGSPG